MLTIPIRDDELNSVTLERPIDVPTADTVSFVASHAPRGGEILEIGCGAGQVASELSKRGYHVIGVDSDKDAISRARMLGVETVCGEWPDVDVSRVDVVVFTRSLHHISPLPNAIARVHDVLKPRGTILVEDFAFDRVRQSELSWLAKIIGSFETDLAMSPTSENFIAAVLDSNDAISAWHEDHDHELHTIEDMTAEIDQGFTIRESEQVPYLYRYLVDILPESNLAAAFIGNVLAEERRLGIAGSIALIGRRIAASAP